MSDDEDDEPERQPPTAVRVQRRAWALGAVASRALAEMTDDRTVAAKSLVDLRAWIADTGLDDELEETELAVLGCELGALNERELIKASWRAEGAAVLAWGLGLCELPDHETTCDTPAVLRVLGFLAPPSPDAKPPVLRAPHEIEWQVLRLLGLHWRLRDFSLAPRAVDFRALAMGQLWFGGFDLTGIQLVGDDLAIGGRAIVDTDLSEVRRCYSIAMERHKAIRWLEGASEIYSEVDTST